MTSKFDPRAVRVNLFSKAKTEVKLMRSVSPPVASEEVTCAKRKAYVTPKYPGNTLNQC